MASFISLLILSMTSYLSFLTFQIIHCLSFVFIIALALYCLCWVSFDILMACIFMTENPGPMLDMYIMIGPLFMRGFDIDVVDIDEEYSTYNPALSSWMTSVLAFVLWALPDWVVVLDPDSFLAEFAMVYVNDPYVLHS